MNSGNVIHEGLEWGYFGGSQGVAIDCILGNQQKSSPVIMLIIAEHSKECFQRLICSFRLSICLWVISGRRISADSKTFAQFLEQLGCESGVAIGDDFVRYSVMYHHMLYV